MSNITTNALNQLNQDKQAQVVDQAQAKITYILRERASIASHQDAVKVHQEAVNKIAEDVITAESVFGRPASMTPTQNEATILRAIKERNDDKQKCVEAKSKNHLAEIDGHLSAIKGCEERIKGIQKELSELAVDVITESQVLG